jgi:hypothetical protein
MAKNSPFWQRFSPFSFEKLALKNDLGTRLSWLSHGEEYWIDTDGLLCHHVSRSSLKNTLFSRLPPTRGQRRKGNCNTSDRHSSFGIICVDHANLCFVCDASEHWALS